jgi:hypothetical protein
LEKPVGKKRAGDAAIVSFHEESKQPRKSRLLLNGVAVEI